MVIEAMIGAKLTELGILGWFRSVQKREKIRQTLLGRADRSIPIVDGLVNRFLPEKKVANAAVYNKVLDGIHWATGKDSVRRIFLRFGATIETKIQAEVQNLAQRVRRF